MTDRVPPDLRERQRALDPTCSVLVQAPAGSGKTTLLTERFLSLLAEVEAPGQVVAITFTIAAAAEMRNRILDALRDPEPTALARRVLERSEAGGWKLADLPGQLRISTIDAFCRELALQQPLLSGLGGGLDIAEQPGELYHRAARRTMQQIDSTDSAVGGAIAQLLDWRDNNWQEMEDQLVEMLANRDRWMHDFVLDREPDWGALRERLERPFANAIREALDRLDRLLNQAPGAPEEALELARFACAQPFGEQHRDLAEMAEFPRGPFATDARIAEALAAFEALANLLLTKGGGLRKRIDKNLGFPSERKSEKARLAKLIAGLAAIPDFELALTVVRSLPSLHYSEEDWEIVKACFTVLRHASGELQVVFAEAAKVDFVEVAQIANRVLKAEDGLPTDSALAVADGIRHLLVDEFQDTSRRQHRLLAYLIGAWPDRAGRTCFAVGDPMQSIYFFRQAETELFTRVRNIGLEIPLQPPLPFDFVPLTANFRTVPDLVLRLNRMFDEIFAVNDGSSVAFTSAVPAVALGGPTRSQAEKSPHSSFNLHLNFEPQATRNKASDATTARERDEARENQTKQIVELIESHAVRMGQARANGEKYRIAVLARSAKSLNCLVPAMRDAGIPFRAIGIEGLGARQEVLDALALGCALLNPHDRVAWLGVLRAPWCGLSLDDLHQLTSADDPELMTRPIPELFAERAQLLSRGGKIAACRVQAACDRVRAFRSSSPGALPGTWLQQIWLSLGGADCCDANALANLELLWTCLDRQPGGEQDLLGQALTTALDNLTALPDPAAASDCGVQLMTIHKSKGLEFEVVIVPDLQARVGGGEPKMLSWLERGLAEPDESGEMTEFLIAPRQSKGAERGGTKAWVDRVYTGREWQDERRILYVAATRARTELHLFARPCFKVEQDHSLTLLNPNRSLLAIAWPALEGKIQSRFDEWKSARPAAEAYIESIAASGESNLLVMASATHPAKPTLLRRLPDDYRPPLQALVESSAEAAISGIGGSRLYTRHEGGLVSRALGTAVHTLFEELARLRAAADWPQARAALGHCQPRVAAQIRACCVDQAQAAKLAAEALELALAASNDPVAQWILSPHAEAASEARWAGVVNGGLSTVRVDRMFRAGPSPLVDGQDAWWIIDYKTAHADVPDPAAALPELRKLFAPQIDAYAQVLRNLHGANVVLLAGLYYPRMLTLDWWEI